MTVTDYQRSAFRIPGSRPLTDADAGEMIGNELTVSLHDVVLCTGMVTSARVVDEGANLWVVVESGGRSCVACMHVYPDDQVGEGLRTVASVRTANGGALSEPQRAQCEHRPGWVLVCSDADACQSRRDTKDADPGEPDGPGE